MTDSLNETYGTNINVHRLGINWKGEADLRGVFITDHHGDTLIFSEEIQTNLLSVKKIMDGNLDFGHVDLTNAKLYIKTYKGEVDDNLNIFVEKFDTDEPSSGEIFKLFSNEISIKSAHVKITDENLEVPQIIDYTNVNLNADDFSVIGPDVKGSVKELSLDAARGYSIQNIKAEFSYTLDQIRLDEMLLETESSFVKGTVVLNYGETGLADFVNNVIIDAEIDEAIISSNDLNTVYDEFGNNINIGLQGKIKGTLNNFTFNQGRLNYSNTKLIGNFRFRNLIDSEDPYKITALNHTIASNYFDLRRLMPRLLGPELPDELRTFGNFTVKGDTELFGDLLITDSSISTAAGDAVATFEMGNIHDFSNAFYRGEAVLTNFDLGKISGSTSLGLVDADISFDGRGFTPKTVNTRLKGRLESFNFQGYTYKNVDVSGDLKDPIFDGKLKINDPNLKMDFSGLIDISKEYNQYDFEANIEFAELNKLNLVKRDSVSVFAGRIVMDMEGTTVDDAVGNIEFLETFYQTEKDDYYFDDFLISSFFTKDVRTIEIKSPDIIDGKISGKFLVEDIPNLFQNSVGSIYTNYIPNEVTTNQYIDYEFEIYSKIVELFVPQLELGENTRVKGSVFSDESKFKLDFRSPELLLYENYLGKVNIQLDNDNPLYNAYVSVDSLYTGVYNVSDINIINKTLNDTLYIQSNFVGGKRQEDLFDMALYHTINPQGKSVVGIKKSKITYKDNDWFLNRDNDSRNKITFDNNFNDIKLDSLSLRHNNELIQMAGLLRDSTYTNLKMDFTNVDIGKLVPEIDSLNLKGNINGRLNFLKKQNAFYPSSEIVVEDVNLNNIPFGDLNLRIGGNTDLSKFTINSSLVNENVDSFKAKGALEVTDDNKTTINLDVELKDFNAAAFSPFGGDVITNMRGMVSGEAKVAGNIKSPDINGKLDLKDAGLTVPYLNIDFDLANGTTVDVSKNAFLINETTITDTKYNTFGSMAGSFTHEGFGDWEMDLAISTDRMLVLDTPPDEDALYYGTAFISGESIIKGPVNELVIDVFATTETGTTFKIPISDATSIGDDSFIHFLSPEEKQARISGETIVAEEVKGLSLNFELDINEKAEVEVVVDKVNNSTLKGRGAGILLIEINTLGKFRMWGDFLVIEGKYDFRYGGLVDKTIDVLGGGNITWDGNPTRARLDLTAKYETEANPSVLLDNPSFNRKIPVEVLVDLTGEILKPELDFRIQFPRVSSTVKSELEYKLQDKDQRQTQALFLVSTGSFQSDAAAGNALSNTLAERVNSLVRDIFSSNDKKFVFLPSVSTTNNNISQQTEYQIGVELSTRISERVLINGKVGVPVGGANESTVAGDIEVQWLVNEDGSLRINFFNRQADLQFIGEDQIFEQGGGIEYSVDFDTFNELMQKLFNKKLTIDNEMPIIPDDNNYQESPNNDGFKEEDE